MTEFTDLLHRSGLTLQQVSAELGVCERTIRRYESGETRPKPRDIAVLKGLIASGVRPRPSNARFRFIDLFAGIGGLRLGFEAIGGKCVFTCEWDKYSKLTYRANFPHDDHEISGDIRQVREQDIPEHDVLLA